MISTAVLPPAAPVPPPLALSRLEVLAQRVIHAVQIQGIVFAAPVVDVRGATAAVLLDFGEAAVMERCKNVFPQQLDPAQWSLSTPELACVEYVYYTSGPGRCLRVLLVDRPAADPGALAARRRQWEYTGGVMTAMMSEALDALSEGALHVPVAGIERIGDIPRIVQTPALAPALARVVDAVVRSVVTTATERGPDISAALVVPAPAAPPPGTSKRAAAAAAAIAAAANKYLCFVDVHGLLKIGPRVLAPARWCPPPAGSGVAEHLSARFEVAEGVHRTGIHATILDEVLPRLALAEIDASDASEMDTAGCALDESLDAPIYKRSKN